MLTPEQLDRYPDNLVELWARTEQSIIADMARRINGFDMFIPSAQWQLAKVKEMGQMEEYILQELAAQSYRSWDDLKALMTEASIKTLEFDDHIYERAGLTPAALKDSPALQGVLLAGLDKTNGLFKNLTNSAAAAGSRQFERTLDLAYMQVTTGAFSHTEAVKNAIKQLSRGGLEAVVYDSGRVEHLDVAVRRAVLTGVNQTAAKLQLARADEMGCDLVEVTAHAGARPSHAVWQGGIYSRSGRSGEQYENFEYATGYGTGPGLCGWNCRHSFFPYFEGISRPAYTKDELEQFNAKNYEYNGVQMTEYEATQKQRYIERQIRRWKREEQGMKAAKLPTDEAKAKLAHWNAVQKDFLEKTGLKRQYDREQVLSNGKLRDLAISGKIRGKTNRKDIADNTSKLKAVMSESDYAEYLKLLNENSNAGIQALYAKYGDRLANLTLSARDGYYVPGKNELVFSYKEKRHIDNGVSKYSTLAHEYGHAFDSLAEIPGLQYREIDTLNAYVTLGSGRIKLFNQIPSASDEFLAAVRRDRGYLHANFKSIQNDLLSTAASAGVQDAISGMFSGTFEKSVVHWGHNDKYYDRKYNDIKSLDLHKTLKQAYGELGLDATSQAKVKSLCRNYETASEMWANIISAQTCGGAELEYVKKYLPNSYEALLKIIGKVE